MEMNIDSIVIVSGGMDSVTLLHHVVKNLHMRPQVISFRYGQKHARELRCAEYHAELLGLPAQVILDLTAFSAAFSASALTSDKIEIPDYSSVEGDEQPPTYVPNRNMTFLSIAAAAAESMGVDVVYYGAQLHDLYGYWDCTTDFLRAINSVLALNRKNPITIEAPFMDKDKSGILAVGVALDVEYERTWTCYNGRELSCGTCPTCAERLKGFKDAGIEDPLEYEAGRVG